MRGWQAIALFIIMTGSLLLAGCGGGSGSNSINILTLSQTVSGVAAAGTPISGTVYLEDSSAPAKEISAQTNSDGSYSLDLTGLTAPFMLVAVGTVNGQSCTLYSLAGAPGIANINPLTNLAVFQASKYAAAQMQTSNTEFFNQYITVIPQIQTLLQQVLTQYGVATANFASDSYTANHSGLDLLFDMVGITVDINSGVLAVTNKMNGASILTTVLKGDTLSGQVITANIPIIGNQTEGAVNVFLENTLIAAGETTSFKHIVVGTTNQAVTWSVVETDGGDITTSGVFTAPAKAGKYHIKFTSASDTKNSTTVEVNVYSTTEYAIPGSYSQPSSIVSGPDGNIWFTEGFGNKIGKITTAGVITEYAIPTTYSEPNAIVSGPDGNLWFTEGSNKIGKITTAGVITEYPVPTADSVPGAIVSGPDGNLWFTEGRGGKIGKITSAGVITEYAIPWSNSTPHSIISGPDGNLWFIDGFNESIGKITTAGVVTEFPVSTRSIIPGPDGNIWFAGKTYKCANNSCAYRDCVGKITTTGVITEYYIPTDGLGANGIISGPDGNLWFIDAYHKSVGVVRN